MDSLAFFRKGYALQYLNENQNAIECFNKSIEINQNYSLAYYNRGNSFFSLKNYQEAIQNYDIALGLNLTDSNVFNKKAESFFELVNELEALNGTNNKIMWQIDEIKRLKNGKNTLGPAPLLIKLGGDKSQLVRNEILKAAKKLKTSTKYKNLSISPDLSVHQRMRLKELNKIKKELNNGLIGSKLPKNFYYGIRNNKIVKIKKDLEEIDNAQFENKIKSLSNELNHIREYFESKILDLFAIFRELTKTVSKINDNCITQSERTLNATEINCKTILNTVNKVDDKMNHIIIELIDTITSDKVKIYRLITRIFEKLFSEKLNSKSEVIKLTKELF
jgi:tetratricopeptide (TPR) repeat protein